MMPMGMRNPDPRATMRTSRQPVLGIVAGAPEQRLQRMLATRTPGLPATLSNGYLPRGVHEVDWRSFAARFGGTPRRAELLGQLQRALQVLAGAGVEHVLVGGSFVTTKLEPGDIDSAWIPAPGRPFPYIDDAAVLRVAPEVHFYRGDDVVDNAVKLGRRAGLNYAEFLAGDRADVARGAVLLATNDATLPRIGGVEGVRSALLGAVRHLR